MTNSKIKVWSKPVVEIVAIKAAQAGGFSTNDAKHTHRS